MENGHVVSEKVDQPVTLQPSGLSMSISVSLVVVVFSLPLCFAELAQRSPDGPVSVHGLVVLALALVSLACLVALALGVARFIHLRPGRIRATRQSITVRSRDTADERVLDRARVASIRYEWRPRDRDDVEGSYLTFIGQDGGTLAAFAFEPLVTERDMSRWMRRAGLSGEIRTRRHAAVEAGAGR